MANIDYRSHYRKQGTDVMMLHKSKLLILCGAALVVAACGHARPVQRTQVGGVLALQGDRNKAMEDAHRQMQQHCQGPYTIIKEGEVVVGQDTVTEEGSESVVTEDGAVVEEGSSASSTRDATEWRIEYECGQAAGAPAAAPEPEEPPLPEPGW